MFFFRIDMDIKLLLEFKDSFGKFAQSFLKIPKTGVLKLPVFNSILGKKKCKKRSIFLSFFYLENQNLKVRLINETVLEKSIKFFLEPDAFSDKQY